MKTGIIIFLIFIFLQPVICQPVDIIPNRYICYKIDGKIDIDGNLSENVWNKAMWTNDFVDILGKSVPLYKTRVKMLWDDNYLYVAAILEEPDIWATLKNRDDIVYRDNDFEVFIDPDGDGKNYFEIEVNAFNTVMDLFMVKPYQLGGKSNLSFNIDGLKTAVKISGTVNNPDDIDKYWTVEMAIPFNQIYDYGKSKTKPNNNEFWRINFSRVNWDTKIVNGKYHKLKKPEYNWVWSPQYIVDMHIPEKWGYLYFLDKTKANKKSFWLWLNLRKDKYSDDKIEKALLKISSAGIKNILVNTTVAKTKQMVKIAEKYGVNVHAWFITMNRRDIAKEHPEWLSVNRENISLKDKKAYVDNYKFLCPAIPEVRNEILRKIEPYCKIKGLNGIHLDYIRYVDAILPVGLWSEYDVIQDKVYSQFDYGYHPYLRDKYEAITGIDPLSIPNPNEDSLWNQFRLDQVTGLVLLIDKLTQKYDKQLSAAVFPSPKMSRRMVYQDWGNWPLDIAFPMLYNGFYNENIDWIGKMVYEDVQTSFPTTKIISGIFAPDLKNPGDISKAIQISLKNGAAGVSIFGLNPFVNDKRWDEVKKIIIEKYL